MPKKNKIPVRPKPNVTSYQRPKPSPLDEIRKGEGNQIYFYIFVLPVIAIWIYALWQTFSK